MPCLKICLPASAKSSDRQFLCLEIQSLDNFNQHLRAEKSTRQKKNAAALAQPENEPSVSESETNIDLQEDVDGTPVLDDEVLRHRQETLEILEGKRKAIPNRDYTGCRDALRFEWMYRTESLGMGQSWNRNLKPLPPTSKILPVPTGNFLRGWQFLHQRLFGGLSDNDAYNLPPWDHEQRAYLLTLREVNGRWCLENAQNISKCSRDLMRTLMTKVQDRGFMGVIQVTYPGSEFSKSFEKADFDGAMVLRWNAQK